MRRRILFGIYFVIAILLTILPPMVTLPPQIRFAGHLIDLTFGLLILPVVAVIVGIYLSQFAAPTTRKRAAWILGVAAASSFGAGQLIGFETFCYQHSFAFCESVMPPISPAITRMFGVDGEYAEDIDMLQVWSIYAFGLAVVLSTMSWFVLRLKTQNADFQNLS
jgi:hypothetical protein